MTSTTDDPAVTAGPPGIDPAILHHAPGRVDVPTQVALYRQMVRMRKFETRAYDLFMENLVKGTSHLSLGQEAIAAAFGEAMEEQDYTFATYRGHAHTLARGSSMTGVMGELLGRSCGVLAGKGGSMHLTDVSHGVMGSYAIVGAHLTIALGAAWSAQYKRRTPGCRCVLWRRHHQYWRVSRITQPRSRLEVAGGLRLREQHVHGVHADRRRDRGRQSSSGSCCVVWVGQHRRRRQRCRCHVPHRSRMPRPRAQRRRPFADRSPHVSQFWPFPGGSGQVPARCRSCRMEGL